MEIRKSTFILQENPNFRRPFETDFVAVVSSDDQLGAGFDFPRFYRENLGYFIGERNIFFRFDA